MLFLQVKKKIVSAKAKVILERFSLAKKFKNSISRKNIFDVLEANLDENIILEKK
jgi:hypothetical protein